MSVKRIYVEKKAPYAVEAKQLLWEIRHILQIKTVTGLRLLNRYDVEGVDDALYQKCLPVVFSEPQVDVTYTELPQGAKAVFAVEYLPGQYDQRAAPDANSTGVSASVPSTVARIMVSRSLFSSGKTTCVSGSPKRQLYSMTFGPFGVIIRPK
mgnify:CR=1 FL=1